MAELLGPSIELPQRFEECEGLWDKAAYMRYHNKFPSELEHIADMEDKIEESEIYINTLYSYRSISTCLPMVSASMEAEEKKKIYSQIFELIQPEIEKLKGCMDFHDQIIRVFAKNMRLLVHPVEKKEVLWKYQMRLLIRLVDAIFRMDFLKESKSHLKNDFSRYRRTFQFIRGSIAASGELHEDIQNISRFLTDPKHPYHIILWHLKEEFHGIPRKYEILNELINLAVDDLKKQLYTTPKEKHGLYRFLCTAIYLIDEEDKKGDNVFKGKIVKLNPLKEVLKRIPVIPIFMDMRVSVPNILSMCRNWDQSMTNSWTSSDVTLLVNKRNAMRRDFVTYTCQFSSMVQELKMMGNQIYNDFESAARCWNLVEGGLKLLGTWSALVQETLAYKYDNPCPLDQFQALGGKPGGKEMSYQMATQFNYKNEEKWIMVEAVGLIKGLAKLMQDAEILIMPALGFCLHKELQDFLQFQLLLPMRRANKKKRKEVLDLMKLLREFGVDAPDRGRLEADYTQIDRKRFKDHKKKLISSMITRTIFPSKVQIILLMRVIREIVDDLAPGMKGGMFTDKTVKKDEIGGWHSVFRRLMFADKVHDYTRIVDEMTDMSCLWFREYYLELTKCVQFPIAMSLPWMLSEFAMSTPSLAPSVFVPLTIYNDCAEKALRVFRSQFLYDEIEAEMQLVWQQLLFTLIRKLFDHYKNQAAQMLIDKPYARAFAKFKRTIDTKLTFARYDSVLDQKHITILGRQIDLQASLSEHLNKYIRDNVEAVLDRFERQDVTMIIELESLLDTLRLTVDMIRKKLPSIDSFEDIMAEKNEDVTLGSYQGRIRHTVLYELCAEVCKRYIYNSTTKRFVRVQKSTREVKHISEAFRWGTRFTQMYQRQYLETREFFGMDHIQSILRVLGTESSAALLEELTKHCIDLVNRDFSPYVEQVLNAVDPIQLQPATFGVIGIYVTFTLKLQQIKAYRGKQQMNDVLREIGNNICCLFLFDEGLTHFSYLNYQVKAFIAGLKPPFEPMQSPPESAVTYGTAATMQFSAVTPARFPDIMQNVLQNLEKTEEMKRSGDFIRSIVSNSVKRQNFIKHQSGGNLFTSLLDRLYETMVKNGFLKLWRGKEPDGKVIEADNPKDFARFWSVVLFLFLVPDVDPDQPQQMAGNSAAIMTDQSYFGDGWTWAGMTILHLLGLTSRFRLFDFTQYLYKLQKIAKEDLRSVPKKKRKKKKGGDKLVGERPFVRELLNNYESWARLSQSVESTLKSHYLPPHHPQYKYEMVDRDQKDPS